MDASANGPTSDADESRVAELQPREVKCAWCSAAVVMTPMRVKRLTYNAERCKPTNVYCDAICCNRWWSAQRSREITEKGLRVGRQHPAVPKGSRVETAQTAGLRSKRRKTHTL